MTTEAALGWRTVDLGFSAGQDFLGLAAPIENILDAETSGITNTTARARYFSLVPWYYWRYTQLPGEGNAQDQRQFAIGFETLLAYANIAWVAKTNVPMSGILRRDYCEARWKEPRGTLPIRGAGVGDTPSPLDAVNYGPSMRRLQLLGRYEQLHTCRRLGQAIAEQVDEQLRTLPGYHELLSAETMERSTIEQWADRLSLNCATDAEVQFLRNLLFGIDERGSSDLPPRVSAFLLLLGFALLSEVPFSAADIETAFVTGKRPEKVAFTVDARLAGAYDRWRVLALLKFLRHASELAFQAVHAHVQQSDRVFVSAQAAAQDLIMKTIPTILNGAAPENFAQWVEACAAKVPTWKATNRRSETVLSHAMTIAAWCQALLRSSTGRALLQLDMAKVGQGAGADLRGYSLHLDMLMSQPPAVAMRWLCVDRAIARHFQVAARKLMQHDTFRLIEDEAGVRATKKCAVADVAIRLDAMLSLLTDVRLLEYDSQGYRPCGETRAWFDSQLRRLPADAANDGHL